MRRARNALFLAAVALALCVPRAGHTAQTDTRMNGIGVLDYNAKPTFKVGDYVRYSVVSLDAGGNPTDQYVMTLLIAGQEIWWGERCFYLETWVDRGKPGSGTAVASLVSYSAFDNGAEEDNVEQYLRKTVLGMLPDGNGLDELLVLPNAPSLTARSSPSKPYTLKEDTLGVDTVQTVSGVLRATEIREHRAWGNTGGSGDSTIYRERTQDRTRWICADVPLTHTARDETSSGESRRGWLIGRSKDAPPAQTTSHGTVSVRVLDWGHGFQSRVLPPDRRHSFDDAPATAGKPAATPRPRRAVGSAARR